MISNKNSSASSTSTLGVHRRRKHMKNKVDDDDEASTLYLDWSNHSTSTKQTTSTSQTSADSLRSLSSAKNLISLSLQQEKEHTESENANRSSRSIGSVLRRSSPSERKRNFPNSNSIGLRLSELTTLSASSQCDDDEYGDDASKGSATGVDDDDELSFTSSGRSIFHKIANRVKMASSSSTNNLAAISELSNDLLADEIETQHRSNYFKNRMSIRVRRASDLLFSSHHRKDLEDEVHEEDF